MKRMTDKQRLYVARTWVKGVLMECNASSKPDNMTDADMNAILKYVRIIAESISKDYIPDLRAIVDNAKHNIPS